jgi:hypothetical protein
MRIRAGSEPETDTFSPGVVPSMQNVAVLGLIVLIRTFLSLSLQLEIEGRLPWQRDVPHRDNS